MTKNKSTSIKKLEGFLEAALFASRWILAPFYVGLVISLALLLLAFLFELWEIVQALSHHLEPERVILAVLSLVDLSLAGNLVLIVVFSGYENFVSKIRTGHNEDRPSWMGTLDFSGLKMKLIGSIVAISAISLLRAFVTLMQAEPGFDSNRIFWMVVLHLTFLTSGVMFALMDWLAAHTPKH
jgi:uncharacterized protein (TIGR00645 family)